MMRSDKNDYLRKVRHYLQHGSYSGDTLRAERSGIRKACNNYAIILKCLKFLEDVAQSVQW